MIQINKRLVYIAAFLPVLTVAISIFRSEIRLRTQPSHIISVRGYDPRDLLRGKYMRFSFNLQDMPSSCKGYDCCVCLDHEPGQRIDPRTLHKRSCSSIDPSCESVIESGVLESSHRYYVPEDAARELEDALRESAGKDEAEVEFVLTSAGGGIQIKELRLGELKIEDAAGRP